MQEPGEHLPTVVTVVTATGMPELWKNTWYFSKITRHSFIFSVFSKINSHTIDQSTSCILPNFHPQSLKDVGITKFPSLKSLLQSITITWPARDEKNEYIL